MPSKMIQLNNGLYIEAEVEENDNDYYPMSGGDAGKVERGIDQLKPILLKACQPIAEVYSELNKDLNIDQIEVSLGLGFEAQGNLFITKASTKANLNIKLIMSPKQPE